MATAPSVHHKFACRHCTYCACKRTYKINWKSPFYVKAVNLRCDDDCPHRLPQESERKRKMDTEPIQDKRKLRILCLHGWRTSGKILSMQTAAMQYHTPLDYNFITAPHVAEGPPDSGISVYYPNHIYYEWFLKSRSKDGHYAGLDESIELVLSVLKRDGPFDGILGFSQGAAMVTKLAHLQESNHLRIQGRELFSFVILIGGVPPLDVQKTTPIMMPSLHVLGLSDPLLEKGRELLQYYDPSTRTSFEHKEGHNIPSLRTGLYPRICEWINNLAS